METEERRVRSFRAENRMIVFLTSSPSGPLDVPNYDKLLDGKNGFVENLRQFWKDEMKGLIAAAAPDSFEGNDEMRDFFVQAFRNGGIPVTGFDLWDYRSHDISAEELKQYDVIMLGGGHVPTENRFFEQIRLREKLKDYHGIVLGVSAGTMNAASVVYAQPELPGESTDPHYRKFLTGLGLTEWNILPHYQMVKHFMLDGKRLFEDITYGDSYGHEFIALEDGSYIRIMNGETLLYGRAHRISDGVLTTICEENQVIILQ